MITLLKYQLKDGTGSPVAWHKNVTGFVSFSSKSIIPSVISAWTKYGNTQLSINYYTDVM